MRYKLIASGGTFDHFHKGHREFIKKQLELSQKVLLGIASNAFVKERKKGEQIQDYQTRKAAVDEFVKQEHAQDRIEIAPIDTIYIPSAWELLPIEAIVATKETENGAILINKKRQGVGLSPLEIIVLEHVLAEDGKSISSQRIRNGEINRNGRLYVQNYMLSCNLYLPTFLRQKLKKPFGEIFQNKDLKQMEIDHMHSIAVGDVATFTLNSLKKQLKISVVDFIVERKKRFNSFSQLGFSGNEIIYKVKNPASSISHRLFYVSKEAFKVNISQQIIVYISGEEDLAVIPFVLTSPLGWKIFYGQPKKGIVVISITEKMKEKMYRLTGKFTRIKADNTRGY